VVGVGETYLGYFFPEAVPLVVDYLKPILLEAGSRDIGRIVQWMRQCAAYWARVGLGATVIAGIEAALWDLAGKLEGASVLELLGGARYERVLAYASAGPSLWPLETLRQKVTSYLVHGYRAFKISSGYETLNGEESPPQPQSAQEIAEIEAEKLRALRAWVGPDVEILLDGHMGHRDETDRWTAEEASAVLRALAPFRPFFVEEPLPYTDLPGYQAVTGTSPVPVAGGEQLTTSEEFTSFLNAGAFSVAQPDASWLGIAGFVEVARLCAQRGLGVAPHAAGAGASIMQNLHTAFACPNVQIVELPTLPGPLHQEIWGDAFRFQDGMLLPPGGPGFGVRLDAQVKRHYQFVPGAEEFSSVPGKPFFDR
jgi:L-alanine-DL-glutamate epimerase-like enolase superfamily enzyme